MSFNNKGYSLYKNDIFNEIEIKANLETEFIGQNLKFFQKIDSTNKFAKEFAKQYYNQNIDLEKIAIVSNYQTNGKGRFGRNWQSQKNTTISLSLILTPNIPLSFSYQISFFISISVCRALKKLTNLDIKLKWPNDIIINEKKLGGILTEVSSELDRLKYVVVGVGLNVNNDEFCEELSNKATSLKLQTGKVINRSVLLASILLEIEKTYKEYKKHLSIIPFLEEYKRLCLNIGRKVKLYYNGKMIFGTVLGINDRVELILLTNDNEKINISSGDISIRNLNGNYI